MTTTDRILIDPDAAARVLDAAERLIGVYTADMTDPTLSDIAAHIHIVNEAIHALIRELAAYHVATEPPPADPPALNN